MEAVVAVFNQKKALVGAFSMITNLRMELFEALVLTQSQHLPSPPPILPSLPGHSLHPDCAPRSVPAAGAATRLFPNLAAAVSWWRGVERSGWWCCCHWSEPSKINNRHQLLLCCRRPELRGPATPARPRDHSAHRPATTTFGQPGADRSRARVTQ